VGLAGQRSRLYRSDLDIQRGAFVQFTFGKAVLGVYVFASGSDAAATIASLGVHF
jgi:hypothetical protein